MSGGEGLHNLESIDNLDDLKEIVILFSHLTWEQIGDFFAWCVANSRYPVGTEFGVDPEFEGHELLPVAAQQYFALFCVHHGLDPVVGLVELGEVLLCRNRQ